MKEKLTGYLGKATAIGREVLARIAPPEPFVVLTSSAPAETWNGAAGIKLAQIVIIAGSENTGKVQVSLYEAVGASNYIDLNATDYVDFGGLDLDDIHLKFEASGDKVHLMYILAEGDIEDADKV